MLEVSSCLDFTKLTPLEQIVEDLYNAHGISSPKLLTIRAIARRLNVWVYFKPIVSKGLEINPNIHTINIDSRLSPIKQWLDFLHELGHLLRHAGNQTILPKLFTQAQEIEAENLILYAAMPFFMISQYKLPGNRKDAIHFLAAAFKVLFKLAEKRLDQIQRREFEGTLMNSYIRFNVDRNIQPTPHIDEAKQRFMPITIHRGFSWALHKSTHIIPNLGSIKATKLKPQHFHDLYHKTLLAKLAVGSIKKVHVIILDALHRAVI